MEGFICFPRTCLLILLCQCGVFCTGVHVIQESEENICLHESEVEYRAYTECTNVTLYHCLLTQTDSYIEICAQPIWIPPGYFPIYSGAVQRISKTSCSPERYQSIGKMSYKFFRQTCESEKSVCNAREEITCNDGSMIADRKCACNYTAGYAAYAYIVNPEKKSCFTPSIEQRGCYIKPCPDGKELDPAYECVYKCPEGYHRPFWELDCKKIPGEKLTTTGITSKIVTASPRPLPPKTTKNVIPHFTEPPSVIKQQPQDRKVIYVIMIIVIACLIGLVVFGIVVRYCCKWCSPQTPKHPPVNFRENKPNKVSKSHLILSDLVKKFRHADSDFTVSDYDSSPDVYDKRPVIYNEFHIKDTKNIIIGNDGRIEKIRVGKRAVYSETSETDATPKTKRKEKPRKRRKRKKSEISQHLSESESDNEESELLKNERKFTQTYQPRFNDKEKQTIKPRADSLGKLQMIKDEIDFLSRKKYGRYLQDVPGDGHCLYHAFIMLLKQNFPNEYEEMDVEKLRRYLVKFLESNPNTPGGLQYKEFLSLPSDPDRGLIHPEDIAIEEKVENISDQMELRWQRFLKRIQDGDWGGSLELQGLSQMFNVPINVLRLNENQDDLLQYNFNSGLDNYQNPPIWLGHISLEGRGFHFVALLPVDTGENGTGTPSSPTPRDQSHFHRTKEKEDDNEGANLRKNDDVAGEFQSYHNFFHTNCQESIGIIIINNFSGSKHSKGTGFRVGTKYLMTAYHVVDHKIEMLWNKLLYEVIKRIKETVSDGGENWRKFKTLLNISQNKSITDILNGLENLEFSEEILDKCFFDHRRVSDLVKVIKEMNIEGCTEMVERLGKETFSSDSKVVFCYTKTEDTDQRKVFKLSCEIPYISKTEDVVILELVEEDSKITPKRFVLDVEIAGSNEDKDDKMHVVGHPNGRPLVFDPNCKIVKDKQRFEKDKIESVNFFTKLVEDKNMKLQIENEFKTCLVGGNKLLFHCSKSIAHGASGSPCFVQHGHITKVKAMLQKGCPSLYYKKRLKKFEDQIDRNLHHLIEKGISMRRLRDVMEGSKDSKVMDLCDDLFDQQHDDSRTVICTLDKEECERLQPNEVLEKFKRTYNSQLYTAYLGTKIPVTNKKAVIVAVTTLPLETPTAFSSEYEGFEVIHKNIHNYKEELKSAKQIAVERPLEKLKFDEVERIIQENSDNLMKKHSNLEIISGSSARSCSGGNKTEYQVCITLYCTAKGYLPDKEEKFPKEIGGFPVDVREGLFFLYTGSLFARGGMMQQDYIQNLKMGCNIGVSGADTCGSLGGFVEVENEGLCFLTCAHVLHSVESVLKNQNNVLKDLDIVQPADKSVVDSHDRLCGKHLESVFDHVQNWTVDVSLIKVNGNREPLSGNFTPVMPADITITGFSSEPKFNLGKTCLEPEPGVGVIKVGAATGLTRGILQTKGCSVRIRCGDTEYTAHGLYEIVPDKPVFFADCSDSGSFVFKICEGNGDGQSLQCIGMLVGGTTHSNVPYAYVIPIGAILSAFRHYKITGLKTFTQ